MNILFIKHFFAGFMVNEIPSVSYSGTFSMVYFYIFYKCGISLLFN